MKRTKFKSFEQFKLEQFPKLTENERLKEEDQNSVQLGVKLANNAINNLLSTGETKTKSKERTMAE